MCVVTKRMFPWALAACSLGRAAGSAALLAWPSSPSAPLLPLTRSSRPSSPSAHGPAASQQPLSSRPSSQPGAPQLTHAGCCSPGVRGAAAAPPTARLPALLPQHPPRRRRLSTTRRALGRFEWTVRVDGSSGHDLRDEVRRALAHAGHAGHDTRRSHRVESAAERVAVAREHFEEPPLRLAQGATARRLLRRASARAREGRAFWRYTGRFAN